MILYRKDKHFRILKSLSVKLSDDKTFILTYMYYTDKMNKDNNQYRYEGMVVDNNELEGHIRQMEANPANAWKWGYDVPNDFTMFYHNDTNREGAAFLKARLKKSLESFDEFLAKANENPVKRYPLKGYKMSDGTDVDITNKDILKNLCGKSFSHVRDRAEKTFDVYDPQRKFRRYNSNMQAKMDLERERREKRLAKYAELQRKHEESNG